MRHSVPPLRGSRGHPSLTVLWEEAKRRKEGVVGQEGRGRMARAGERGKGKLASKRLYMVGALLFPLQDGRRLGEGKPWRLFPLNSFREDLPSEQVYHLLSPASLSPLIPPNTPRYPNTPPPKNNNSGRKTSVFFFFHNGVSAIL